jgi:hypothetical protein
LLVRANLSTTAAFRPPREGRTLRLDDQLGGGLLLYQELDDVFGLHDLMGKHLLNTRAGHNCLHSIVALAGQPIFGRLAGRPSIP